VNRCTCFALNSGADDRQPGGRVSGPMAREAPRRSGGRGIGKGNGHGARRCDVTANTVVGFLFGFEEEVQVGLGGGRGRSR